MTDLQLATLQAQDAMLMALQTRVIISQTRIAEKVFPDHDLVDAAGKQRTVAQLVKMELDRMEACQKHIVTSGQVLRELRDKIRKSEYPENPEWAKS